MVSREFSDRNKGRSAVGPAGAGFAERLNSKYRFAAAALVGLAALGCYCATLLPGLDFGDTASFQTGVGSLTLTPRQAYPLYYALGNLVAWLDPHEPAHAMNLASAVYGAFAAALAAWVAVGLTSSLTGGIAAGLFLAFSYTFWTQAIIAEVYTLHLLMIGVCLAALLAWAENPTLKRLAVFYAVYALGFGNHLSMILLLPGFAAFIILNRRRGTQDPLQPRAIGLALGIAALGSLQYAWNFAGLWSTLEPPSNILEAVGKFWMDVTKSDWRETLVMSVSASGLQNRPALYWFDVHQQFGSPGVVLAIAGGILLGIRRRGIGLMLLLLYGTNLLFAWTYNVGDVHVFFLPSHYVVALFAGAGVAALANGRPGWPPYALRTLAVLAVLCLAYPIWRAYDTFPAVDRSWDRRPEQLLDQFTAPPNTGSESDAIFGVDSNWQVQNAFEYYMRERKPAVPWFTSLDLEWLERAHARDNFQRFIDTNRMCCSRVVIVGQPLEERLSRIGLDFSGSSREGPPALTALIGRLGRGRVYALAILRPYREFPIDVKELTDAYSGLTAGSGSLPPLSDYTIIAGRMGERPAMVVTHARPFRAGVRIGASTLDIRMESWLPTDTIRRAGFGHVIVNRRHVLAIDRGISFVALGAEDAPSQVEYRSGLFAPLPRVLLGNARKP